MTHAICDESIELENEVISNDKVQGFNGSAVCITSKGDLKVKDTSTGCVVELKNARKLKDIKKNIVSIGQLQNEGWTLRGHDSIFVMEKGDRLLRFEKSGEEKNLYYMDATVVSKAQVLNVLTDVDFKEEDKMSDIEKAIARNDGDPIPVSKTEIDINVAHDQWGHHGERRLKEMASVYGFRLTGKLNPCDACGIAKASQTRISKSTKIKATMPGERLFMDTTGPFSECLPNHKYLHGAVDDFSDKMFAQFSGTKTQMTHFAEKVIKRCEGEKKEVKYIRIDGRGENKGIEDLVEEMGGITIEKTPLHTPQYNGRIERRFPIIVLK